MKLLPLLAFALVATTATAALAHVDSLGQPDPYWQQVAATAAAGDADAPRDSAAPLQDLTSSGGLSLLLLLLGAALALDVATAPARGKPTADPSAGTTGEAAVRTVPGLPPSASGETRHVLRAAAVIAVAALAVSAIHAGGRGDDRAPRGRDLAPFQAPARDATPAVQRAFGELQAGATAAEAMRVATQRWPAAEMRTAHGVFPGALPVFSFPPGSKLKCVDFSPPAFLPPAVLQTGASSGGGRSDSG